jgi:hypothetical protein
VDWRSCPELEIATHAPAFGHETPDRDPPGLTNAMLHGAVVLGVLVDKTSPTSSTATQSDADGQESAVMELPDGLTTLLHDAEVSPMFDPSQMEPSSAPATQLFGLKQLIASSDGPGVVGWLPGRLLSSQPRLGPVAAPAGACVAKADRATVEMAARTAASAKESPARREDCFRIMVARPRSSS